MKRLVRVAPYGMNDARIPGAARVYFPVMGSWPRADELAEVWDAVNGRRRMRRVGKEDDEWRWKCISTTNKIRNKMPLAANAQWTQLSRSNDTSLWMDL